MLYDERNVMFFASVFLHYRDVDDLLTSGSQIEKLLVAHPAIIPVEAHILYVAYDGWIYSGRFQWSLDKLILTDVDGKKKSFCKENGQYLPSGIPVKLKLKSGDCVTNSLKAPPDYPIVPFRKVELVKYVAGNNKLPSLHFVPVFQEALRPSAPQTSSGTPLLPTRQQSPASLSGAQIKDELRPGCLQSVCPRQPGPILGHNCCRETTLQDYDNACQAAVRKAICT